MQLSGIQGFLEEYRKRLFQADGARHHILEIINKTSGVTILEKEIEIKKNEIILSTDLVAKNQIFLYKEKILKQLVDSGVKDIYDIR